MIRRARGHARHQHAVLAGLGQRRACAREAPVRQVRVAVLVRRALVGHAHAARCTGADRRLACRFRPVGRPAFHHARRSDRAPRAVLDVARRPRGLGEDLRQFLAGSGRGLARTQAQQPEHAVGLARPAGVAFLARSCALLKRVIARQPALTLVAVVAGGPFAEKSAALARTCPVRLAEQTPLALGIHRAVAAVVHRSRQRFLADVRRAVDDRITTHRRPGIQTCLRLVPVINHPYLVDGLPDVRPVTVFDLTPEHRFAVHAGQQQLVGFAQASLHDSALHLRDFRWELVDRDRRRTASAPAAVRASTAGQHRHRGYRPTDTDRSLAHVHLRSRSVAMGPSHCTRCRAGAGD